MVKNESKKVVNVFSIASFLNDMGSDMIYPIWPLFVTSFLGANLEILGLLDGLGEAIVSISQAISGYLSDRIQKRKVFILAGYLFGGLSRIGYALSTTWEHLIPFRILDRAGKMRGSPRDAVIADVSSNKERGRNFGLLQTMDNLGAVVGIIACILFFNYLGYRNLLFIAAIPSFIGVTLLAVFIKERKTKKIFKGFTLKDLDNNFKLFLILSSVFALGSFSYSFLLIYAKDFGFATVFVPVLYLVFTLVASLMSLPFGKLADRVGRKIILISSYIFFAVMCVGFIFIKSYVGIILLFVLYGLHRAAIDPVQKAFVSELSIPRVRASSLGTYQMVTGLFALPASIIAGVLWTSFNMFVSFYFSLGLTGLSIILMLFVKEKIRV